MKTVLLLALFAGLKSAPTFGAAPPPVDLRVKLGDDPRWAAPEWNDRDWQRLSQQGELGATGLPAQAGVYWTRIHLQRSDLRGARPVAQTFFWPRDEPGSPINSIFLPAVFSYELYWDGHLIGHSGTVGSSRAIEVPGPLDQFLLIPPECLGPGPHVAALRMSSYHFNFPGRTFSMYFALENFAARLVYETRQSVYPLVSAGIAALTGVFCLVLAYFTQRRRALLLCGAIGFTLALFYYLVARRWLHNDPYTWLAPRYNLIDALMTLLAVLQPLLLLEQFSVPRRGWWLLPLGPALLLCWLGADLAWERAAWMCRAMLAISLVITVWAAGRKRPGAWFALAGVLIGLTGSRVESRSFLGPAFTLAFGGSGLGVLTAIGLQIRADRRRTQEMSLTAARLEIELLKKNIQPHFLMNTLTTIMEVIEDEPKLAVTLVDALAEEFRILERVSGEKLIPLGQELALCRAHIRIMSMRKGVKCSLSLASVDESAPVPPAIFHTLIEGGFTHQLPRQGELKFVLSGESQPTAVRYRLLVEGENPPPTVPLREGTGLRYVKARLEESYAGRWSLNAGPVPAGWQTTIEIRSPVTEDAA